MLYPVNIVLVCVCVCVCTGEQVCVHMKMYNNDPFTKSVWDIFLSGL